MGLVLKGMDASPFVRRHPPCSVDLTARIRSTAKADYSVPLILAPRSILSRFSCQQARPALGTLYLRVIQCPK